MAAATDVCGIGSLPCGDHVAIEKPETDHREYRHLTLENGLRAIVISDSKCDKAAAALSVKVGFFSDPKEVQGLAHFCEHMLFLGTEKYPDEGEYNEFLAKRGGSSNAFTTGSITTFFFCVSPDSLWAALDRFAQFFLCPLFTESATDRELNAVDSEHSKNQQSDTWRWAQLQKNDANPAHPICQFGTGNSETLKNIPEQQGVSVRQHLLDFHKAYYSANLMCMCILGKESLEELADVARVKFGAIANTGATMLSGPELGRGQPAFTRVGWPRLVRVIPVKEVRQISFEFVLPQQYPMLWRTQPSRYLSFCIGHEGKGSVLSVAKMEGLATGLTAGATMDEGGACVFSVTVVLTEKGEREALRVGELVFAYIRLLQATPVDVALWREMQCVQEMNFRFRSVEDPGGKVVALSGAMQDGLPVEKVISGPAKLWDLDAEGISICARLLTFPNLRVLFALKSWTEEECGEVERWYGTHYGAAPLPDPWRLAWEKCLAEGSEAAEAVAAAATFGLSLPAPNPFVAEDLDLRPRPMESGGTFPVRMMPLPPSLREALSANKPGLDPERLAHIFFRQDDKFDLPKAHLAICIYCPWTAESNVNRVVTNFWCHAVMEELNELSYDADGAGLRYKLTGHSRGVTLSFSGYNDKLPVLLRAVADRMAALGEISEHTFNLVHCVFLRSARTAAKSRQPYQQASEWVTRTLARKGMTSLESLKVIEALTHKDVQGVNRKLFDHCYSEALLQGNFLSSDVGTVFEAILPVLQPGSALESVPPLAGLCLVHAPGSCVLVEVEGTNSDERNGAVMMLLQAAEETLENVIFTQLVVQVLGQRCFDELRTKQQLGYIVSLSPFQDSMGKGFCGLHMIVQSEMHPAEVHRRMDSWLLPALTHLTDPAEFSEEQFAEYNLALLTSMREKPKMLAQEFGRNWGEVSSRNFRFTRRDECIAFLERPTAEILSELRDFVRQKLLPAPRFCVEVLGATAKEKAAKPAEGDQETFAAARPYENAAQHLKSTSDIEAFRAELAWVESTAPIGD